MLRPLGREVGAPTSAPRRPKRGGVLLAILLPGFPQFLGGRILVGGFALLLWASFVGIGSIRWERVVAAPGGGWDERAALLTLLCGLMAIWTWSIRDATLGSGVARTDGSWARFAREFGRNRVASIGLGAVGISYLAALLAPFLAPFDPAFQGDLVVGRLSAPSGAHLLGTDQFARDVFSRLLYGARVSLSIGFIAVAISMTIGTLVGAVAGFLGGWWDAAIMRFVDMVISFPRLVLLITVIALFEPSLFVLVVLLGLTQWPLPARIVRGEVLSLREREFMVAGRALGFRAPRLIFRHLIPNTLAPVTVAATLGIGDTIILEAGLSFLGLGIQPPTPSWGTMVADGRNHLLGAWWVTTFPGLAIVLVVLSFNLAGDGLRDALDPRLRR